MVNKVLFYSVLFDILLLFTLGFVSIYQQQGRLVEAEIEDGLIVKHGMV